RAHAHGPRRRAAHRVPRRGRARPHAPHPRPHAWPPRRRAGLRALLRLPGGRAGVGVPDRRARGGRPHRGRGVMGYAVISLALGGLGRDALKVATSLALAILLALAFAIASLMAAFGTMAPGQPIAAAQPGDIPPAQFAVMQQAAATCGLPWQVLAGVAKVESDFGRNMATSSAGAIGYAQFLPSSWAAFGQGGNPYDYRDAIPAMARYLCAHGGSQDLRRALFAYNHADWYVDQVLAVAVRYGHLAPGAPDAQVVDLARAQIGKPYVWGGASPQTSFD